MEKFEADNAWHSLDVHQRHCKMNPSVIRMIEFHKNRPREEYNIVKWEKRSDV